MIVMEVSSHTKTCSFNLSFLIIEKRLCTIKGKEDEYELSTICNPQ